MESKETSACDDKTAIVNLIDYWRNSLADSDKQAYKFDQISPLKKHFSLKTFESGKLPVDEIKVFFEDAQTRLNEKNIRNARYKKNIDETGTADQQDIPVINKLCVLIAPYTANRMHQHGKKMGLKGAESSIFPLMLLANINREGELTPFEEDTYPWIGREYLVPNEKVENHLILGTVSQVDEFYTAKKPLLDEANLKWETLFSLSTDLISSLAKGDLSTLFSAQYYALKEEGCVIPFNDIRGVSHEIIKTYDQYLTNRNKEIPPLLSYFCSFEKKEQQNNKSNFDIFMASKHHYGQMHNEYPLSESQRISLSYFFDGDKNDPIFTINGPPGTGKTSLLLSIISSQWIDAAIAKKSPPLLTVVSTNNLAVTNILDCFKQSSTNDASLFSMRWLPEITSYGLYLVSNNKAQEAQKNNYLYRGRKSGISSVDSFYTSQYRKKAQTYFLEKFNAHYKKEESDIIQCQNYIHKEILEKKTLLDKVFDLAHKYHVVTEKLFNPYGSLEALKEMISSRVHQKAVLQAAIKKLGDSKQDWLSYKSVEKLNQLAIKHFIFRRFKKELSDKIEIFASKYPEFFSAPVKNVFSMNRFFSHNLKKEIRNFNQVDDELTQLKLIERDYETFDNDKIALERELDITLDMNRLFDFSDNQEILSKLDTTIRYDLFLLATHYWEISWLRESESFSNLKYDRASRKKYWQIQAMLTPCFVTTLHTGPSFFQHKDSDQEFKTLSNFLDLLIIDEAGQVMPAIAGSMISTAKKALFVGDIHQLEPIFSILESIDIANAKKFKLCKDQKDYEDLKKLGILCSGDKRINHAYGNVIIIGQRKSKYHLKNHTVPGLMLKEHRRCAKEIISYCNELCYDNQLIPMTPEVSFPYPRMGYAHIKGNQTKSGASRFNAAEAMTIAHWLNKNKEKITKHCGAKSLNECVGIITPFFAQKEAIFKELRKHNLFIEKVGTVHALQGAEKDIVIFSSVYTAEEQQGEFFFDRSPNMLNVAVSRAKKSFLVFGDMDIFDPLKGNQPSSLLSNYLFACEENEIVDIIQAKFSMLNDSDTKQLTTLAEHRNVLTSAFSQAVDELHIISPLLAISAIKHDNILELIGQHYKTLKIFIYSDPTFHHGKYEEFLEAQKILQKAGALVFSVERVHSKVIAIDNRILISGSFNWLSASRTDPRFMRDEVSVFYDGKNVRQFIQDALKPVKIKAGIYESTLSTTS